MRRATGRIHGAAGRHQRLADHLPPEDALPTDLRRATTKQIELQLLEIQDTQEILNGR